MGRPELSGAIPTATACYWRLAEPIPSPLGDGGRLVRFLNDQQDVLFWHLLIAADGTHRVVAGGIPYDEVMVTPAQAEGDLIEVAPSFEAFMWRFWVENITWYELEMLGLPEQELSQASRDYLRHYGLM